MFQYGNMDKSADVLIIVNILVRKEAYQHLGRAT